MIRRNLLVMFMCVELMLNAVNLSFVARPWPDDVGGHNVFCPRVAAERCRTGDHRIIMRRRQGSTADDISLMRGSVELVGLILALLVAGFLPLLALGRKLTNRSWCHRHPAVAGRSYHRVALNRVPA